MGFSKYLQTLHRFLSGMWLPTRKFTSDPRRTISARFYFFRRCWCNVYVTLFRLFFHLLIDRRQYSGTAAKPEDVEIIHAFGKEFREKLLQISGREHLTIYTNFAKGDEGPAAWYPGESLQRLVRLKKTYDPDALFSFYNAIE